MPRAITTVSPRWGGRYIVREGSVTSTQFEADLVASTISVNFAATNISARGISDTREHRVEGSLVQLSIRDISIRDNVATVLHDAVAESADLVVGDEVIVSGIALPELPSMNGVYVFLDSTSTTIFRATYEHPNRLATARWPVR